MCAILQEPNFMGRFSLILEWVSGETPLDILEMSHLHYMFGKQHEWDGIDDVSKTCVDTTWKEELGWKTEGLSTQRREPPFLLNKGKLLQQMHKLSVTLAKNTRVKLLNAICRACFDFVSVMADCLSMHRAYMAHTGKGCTLSRCRIMEGFFNIDYTLGSGRTLGVSILDSEWCEIWLQFWSHNANEYAYIACVVRLNKCSLVLYTKWTMVWDHPTFYREGDIPEGLLTQRKEWFL